MKGIIFCLTLMGLISCGHVFEKNNENKVSQFTYMEIGNKSDNALAFINGYVEDVKKMNNAVDLIEWVNSNKWSTDGFKKELNWIINKVYFNKFEFGYDSDPIFDAQEYPKKGFVIESIDDNSNYLTIKGEGCFRFSLTIKMKNENGIWLVDGCGLINIPNEKRPRTHTRPR